MTSQLARVTVIEEPEAIIASVEGEVDLSNVDEIRSMIVDAVEHETDALIVDLSRCTYLDSTGVRLLFDLADRMQRRRQRLRLVVTDRAIVRRVLVLTQLDERVPLHPTIGDALRDLREEEPSDAGEG